MKTNLANLMSILSEAEKKFLNYGYSLRNYAYNTSIQELDGKINVVPIVLEGTLNDAVEYIKKKPFSKIAQEVYVMEGVVGRPKIELNDRCSNRVIVKIKVNDFEYNDFL